MTVVVALSADRWFGRLRPLARGVARRRLPAAELPEQRGGAHPRSSPTCHALLSQYPGGRQSSFAHAYNFAIPVFEEGLPLLMVVIGALVGAPLVAREVEQRTQLVSWTQSVTRRRWYVTKVTALAACSGVAGLSTGVVAHQLQLPL